MHVHVFVVCVCVNLSQGTVYIIVDHSLPTSNALSGASRRHSTTVGYASQSFLGPTYAQQPQATGSERSLTLCMLPLNHICAKLTRTYISEQHIFQTFSTHFRSIDGDPHKLKNRNTITTYICMYIE